MKTDVFSPNQRRIILDSLEADNDYSLNNGILQKILVQFGHGIGMEKTDQEITWLEEHGLVTVEKLTESLNVVKLTSKGLDVAHGHDRVDGVERPGVE